MTWRILLLLICPSWAQAPLDRQWHWPCISRPRTAGKPTAVSRRAVAYDHPPQKKNVFLVMVYAIGPSFISNNNHPINQYKSMLIWWWLLISWTDLLQERFYTKPWKQWWLTSKKPSFKGFVYFSLQPNLSMSPGTNTKHTWAPPQRLHHLGLENSSLIHIGQVGSIIPNNQRKAQTMSGFLLPNHTVDSRLPKTNSSNQALKISPLQILYLTNAVFHCQYRLSL